VEPVDQDTERRRALSEEYEKRPDPIFAKITGRGRVELPVTPSGHMFVLPAGGQGYALNLLDLFQTVTALPLIQYGNATGANAGQWYQVAFPKRYSSTPNVVASGVYRTGNQTQRQYTAPTFSAPRFTVPTFSAPNFTIPSLAVPTLGISLPALETTNWKSDLRANIGSFYRMMMGNFAKYSHDALSKADVTKGPGNAIQGVIYGPSWADIDTDDQIVLDSYGYPSAYTARGKYPAESPDAIYARTKERMKQFGERVAGVAEDIANRLIPDAIKKFRDSSQASINSTLGSYNKGIKSMLGSYNKNLQSEMNKYTAQLNNKIGTFSGNLQTQMNGFSNSVQDATNQVSKQAENSINQAINQLYSFLGCPATNRLTVAQIKSVTVDGFQFLSQGDMEIQWIAVGS